jgi:HlyD family secretion protein
MNSTDFRTQRLCAFFEHMQRADVARLAELYAENAHFVDPFNDVFGLQPITQIFQHMFDTLDEPRFVVIDALTEGDQALLTWDFHFRRQGQAKPWRIHGSTHVRYGADGLVTLHRDYWDAAGELYAELPVIGALVRWLGRQLRTPQQPQKGAGHLRHNARMPVLASALRLSTCGAIACLLSACKPAPVDSWSGYAEADHVYVAAPLAGQLTAVSVQVGQSVQAGDVLFALESGSEQAALREAQARVQVAQAQLNNLQTGRRPSELAVTQAQLAQARAQAAQAEQLLARDQALKAQGFVAPARVDDAHHSLAQAQARVQELQAAVQVGQLPARAPERAAAQAQVAAAQQALQQSQWRLTHKQATAPQAGVVTEIFYQLGEQVGVGQSVLALLPPYHLNVRFFVPEAALPSLRLGQSVRVQCDACGQTLSAQIGRIASAPEYTPPVIYSNAQRHRLVYLVEARVQGAGAQVLRPGQPVEVRPGQNP